ncbi:MAG: phage holin family protein [Deltaproteobacteria bacterium HGW-Deltaproteobacteria-7]|nr:MAG: phage holin family protein [Deltaproteobacteria bacterium HGW-Deltaproteobacteria-7]PKN20099.1 MAG: phage holin family protein [Deltaproteobacteria bacterium HGW-Deltaproteobacteria-6]
MLVLITRWLVITVAILIASNIVPGISVDSLKTAIIAAAILGIINVFLRPVLLILTLPLTILTLGVFAFVINALMLLLVSHFVPEFKVDGFLSAFLGTLIISLVSWIANRFINKSNNKPDVNNRQKPDYIDLEQGDDGKWR